MQTNLGMSNVIDEDIQHVVHVDQIEQIHGEAFVVVFVVTIEQRFDRLRNDEQQHCEQGAAFCERLSEVAFTQINLLLFQR